MCVIIILTKFLENDQKKICSFFYYITNFLIIIPFCLRFRRITISCQIKIDQKLELQESNANKYCYEEKHSLKIMILIFILLTGVLIASNAFVTTKEAITAKFLYKGSNELTLESANSYIWLGVNFIEHIILLSYVYKICINQLKQKLRFEIISCFIIWFLYSNLMAIFEMIPVQINNDVYVYISLAVCYLYLILNGILPIVISYSYRYSTSYSFNPKLMNNLYLFLTNKKCYRKFYNYLMKAGDNSIYMLKLYTHIMKYKLDLAIKKNKEQGLREAKDIYYKYFENEGYLLYVTQDIIIKIQNKCEILRSNNYKEDLFDDGLEYAYNQLTVKFGEFIKSEDFKELNDDIELDSIVQCKMQNTGLINKF